MILMNQATLLVLFQTFHCEIQMQKTEWSPFISFILNKSTAFCASKSSEDNLYHCLIFATAFYATESFLSSYLCMVSL